MKKLNLGRELSKNDQKKILGGSTIVCWHPNPPTGCHNHNWPDTCDDMANMTAYCKGVHGQESYVCDCF